MIRVEAASQTADPLPEPVRGGGPLLGRPLQRAPRVAPQQVDGELLGGGGRRELPAAPLVRRRGEPAAVGAAACSAVGEQQRLDGSLRVAAALLERAEALLLIHGSTRSLHAR